MVRCGLMIELEGKGKGIAMLLQSMVESRDVVQEMAFAFAPLRSVEESMATGKTARFMLQCRQ